MLKANDTMFLFYLEMMDFFVKYLSEKYPNSSSIEDTKHYQAIIVGKIVQMFHTLKLLTENTLDEVSARCLLRCIFDSVTAYCFVYQRDDKDEILFRHYLYVLDGWRNYKRNVLSISEENEFKLKEEYACDFVIKQIEEKLDNHPYRKIDADIVSIIIKDANWKYESFQNAHGLKFSEMYSILGFHCGDVGYLQGNLSQFVHGLSLSNRQQADKEQMKRVVYESILIADRFIKAIYQTYHDKEMVTQFLSSDIIEKFQESEEFNFDELAEFANALVRKDKTILI